MKLVVFIGRLGLFAALELMLCYEMCEKVGGQDVGANRICVTGLIDTDSSDTEHLKRDSLSQVRFRPENIAGHYVLDFPEIGLFSPEIDDLLQPKTLLYGVPIFTEQRNASASGEPTEVRLARIRVSGLASQVNTVDQTSGELQFAVLSARGNASSVLWKRNATQSLLAIRSVKGIGSVRLRRLADRWPQEIFVRLALRGLESLQISDDTETHHWEISSHTPFQISLNVLDKDGQHSEPPADDSGFGKLTIEGDDLRIPLSGGYFQCTIPPRMLQRNPASITVDWIDFYRR